MARSLLPSFFGSEKTNHPAFQSLHNEIDRIFEDFRKPLTVLDRDWESRQTGWLMPKIDVSETDDTIEVVAEIPGVKEKDVDITVTNNVLVIKGEKNEEHEEKKKDYHLVERSKGSYMRSIPLGFDVNPGNVKATFNAGTLTVSVNKPSEIQSQTKKIEVTKAE